MKIRSRTIVSATMKKKKASEKEKDLQEDIQKIERKQFKTETDIKDIDEKKKQLILLHETKMEGVLLRSKAKWVAEGEKITKYLCSLKKEIILVNCDRSKEGGRKREESGTWNLELRLSVDSLVFIKPQRQEDSALETNN